jgi:hypothetical protein
VLAFNDPAAPGKVIVQMGLGDISVTGADVSDVTLTTSEELSDDSAPREDGLRRLNPGVNYSVTREGNTITIRASGFLGGHRHFADGAPNDIVVRVPRGTGVKIERTAPGDTKLENLAGDVEIRAMSGDVWLAGLTGGAVVETMNGDVDAAFGTVAADRPISISTANGDVELRVPADTRATVRFRTLRGDMLTDFDADQLKTLTEDVVRVEEKVARGERVEAEIVRRKAIRAAAMGGAASVPPVPPIPPMPHLPSVPVISGGVVIASDLNGGGTGITITTLSGDIVFRKAK